MSSWFGSQVVRDPDLLSIENDRGPGPYLGLFCEAKSDPDPQISNLRIVWKFDFNRA